MNRVHEQCPKHLLKQCTESKIGLGAPGAHPEPRLHAQACVPALAAMCLLRLLCACSAFYMPQYSRAYCVPAQPSICHNIAEPTVCLLSLLYATIQPSLLYACSAFYMLAQAAVCLLRLLYACSAFSLSHNTASVLQHTCLNFPPGHNTLQCIVT